jgi:hypothetical protein
MYKLSESINFRVFGNGATEHLSGFENKNNDNPYAGYRNLDNQFYAMENNKSAEAYDYRDGEIGRRAFGSSAAVAVMDRLVLGGSIQYVIPQYHTDNMTEREEQFTWEVGAGYQLSELFCVGAALHSGKPEVVSSEEVLNFNNDYQRTITTQIDGSIQTIHDTTTTYDLSEIEPNTYSIEGVILCQPSDEMSIGFEIEYETSELTAKNTDTYDRVIEDVYSSGEVYVTNTVARSRTTYIDHKKIIRFAPVGKHQVPIADAVDLMIGAQVSLQLTRNEWQEKYEVYPQTTITRDIRRGVETTVILVGSEPIVSKGSNDSVGAKLGFGTGVSLLDKQLLVGVQVEYEYLDSSVEEETYNETMLKFGCEVRPIENLAAQAGYYMSFSETDVQQFSLGAEWSIANYVKLQLLGIIENKIQVEIDSEKYTRTMSRSVLGVTLML